MAKFDDGVVDYMAPVTLPLQIVMDSWMHEEFATWSTTSTSEVPSSSAERFRDEVKRDDMPRNWEVIQTLIAMSPWYQLLVPSLKNRMDSKKMVDQLRHALAVLAPNHIQGAISLLIGEGVEVNEQMGETEDPRRPSESSTGT